MSCRCGQWPEPSGSAAGWVGQGRHPWLVDPGRSVASRRPQRRLGGSLRTGSGGSNHPGSGWLAAPVLSAGPSARFVAGDAGLVEECHATVTWWSATTAPPSRAWLAPRSTPSMPATLKAWSTAPTCRCRCTRRAEGRGEQHPHEGGGLAGVRGRSCCLPPSTGQPPKAFGLVATGSFADVCLTSWLARRS